ncbi:hypothetical protein SNE40_019591 [Patella caerulea]|uniref:Uncharacterized protein n=1 Tax=Patella caerulea TaxID=87958 RepID=A0AAN8J6R4_PATCE
MEDGDEEMIDDYSLLSDVEMEDTLNPSLIFTHLITQGSARYLYETVEDEEMQGDCTPAEMENISLRHTNLVIRQDSSRNQYDTGLFTPNPSEIHVSTSALLGEIPQNPSHIYQSSSTSSQNVPQNPTRYLVNGARGLQLEVGEAERRMQIDRYMKFGLSKQKLYQTVDQNLDIKKFFQGTLFVGEIRSKLDNYLPGLYIVSDEKIRGPNETWHCSALIVYVHGRKRLYYYIDSRGEVLSELRGKVEWNENNWQQHQTCAFYVFFVLHKWTMYINNLGSQKPNFKEFIQNIFTPEDTSERDMCVISYCMDLLFDDSNI